MFKIKHLCILSLCVLLVLVSVLVCNRYLKSILWPFSSGKIVSVPITADGLTIDPVKLSTKKKNNRGDVIISDTETVAIADRDIKKGEKLNVRIGDGKTVLINNLSRNKFIMGFDGLYGSFGYSRELYNFSDLSFNCGIGVLRFSRNVEIVIAPYVAIGYALNGNSEIFVGKTLQSAFIGIGLRF